MDDFFVSAAHRVKNRLKIARAQGKNPDFRQEIWNELCDFQGDRDKAFRKIQHVLSEWSAQKKKLHAAKKAAVTTLDELLVVSAPPAPPEPPAALSTQSLLPVQLDLF